MLQTSPSRQNDIFNLRKMTSLFRPWTEEGVEKNEIQRLSNLFPDYIQNESGLWLMGTKENRKSDVPGESNTSERELRYRNVKEHMKKRSEKYLLKKLKLKEEKSEIASEPSYQSLDYSRVACAGYPPPCYPPGTDMIPAGLDLFSASKMNGMCFSPGFTCSQTSDLLETALSQGFPPNLFEEYARFLTDQQKQVADKSRKQRPKKFRCPHCQVGFSNNGQLKGHIRIHTGERPFKCDAESCGKSFTRNEELTRHRRIHSGLRPFPCSECGKRFGRKDHLKKHVKTHFQQRYQLVPILPSHCPYFYGL